MPRTLIAGLALSLLAACQAPEATELLEQEIVAMPQGGPVARIAYVCNGETLAAALTRGAAQITWRGTTYTLDRVAAESGSKFAGGGAMFWETGATALFEIDGEAVYSCERLPASAAGVPAADALAALKGPAWTVEDIARTGIIDMSNATLEFGEDGALSGRASCNRYSGRWSAQGDGLQITPLAVTRMACAPALMAQEQRFLDILGKVTAFQIDETGALVLSTPDGTSLLARR